MSNATPITSGLYNKYAKIERNDGQSAPGAKHDGCQYFVLDITHDPHAIPAMIAYANACEATHPSLAIDIRAIPEVWAALTGNPVVARDGAAGTRTMFRKKPVVIEAMHFDGDNAHLHSVYQWIEKNTQGSFDVNDPGAPVPESGVSIDAATGFMVIATLEGIMQVKVGDYVIRGVQGEFYPCKPDIFRATYEEVDKL